MPLLSASPARFFRLPAPPVRCAAPARGRPWAARQRDWPWPWDGAAWTEWCHIWSLVLGHLAGRMPPRPPWLSRLAAAVTWAMARGARWHGDRPLSPPAARRPLTQLSARARRHANAAHVRGYPIRHGTERGAAGVRARRLRTPPPLSGALCFVAGWEGEAVRRALPLACVCEVLVVRPSGGAVCVCVACCVVGAVRWGLSALARTGAGERSAMETSKGALSLPQGKPSKVSRGSLAGVGHQACDSCQKRS